MRIKKEKPRNEIHRAVFLDRDGVINHVLVRDGKSCPPTSLDQLEILPGVFESCKKLKEAGYIIVVATNQPDVGRGTLRQNTVEEMHNFLLKHLPIDRIEVCYHPGRGQSDCQCRKPRPGMLLRAAQELGLDLLKSWMIGDRFGDIIAGQAVGCRTILVGGGYNEESQTTSDFHSGNLVEAVEIILGYAKIETC